MTNDEQRAPGGLLQIVVFEKDIREGYIYGVQEQMTGFYRQIDQNGSTKISLYAENSSLFNKSGHTELVAQFQFDAEFNEFGERMDDQGYFEDLTAQDFKLYP